MIIKHRHVHAADRVASGPRNDAAASTGTLRALALAALLAAIALMSFYVQVLHDSVERGQQFREGQRLAAPAATLRVKPGSDVGTSR